MSERGATTGSVRIAIGQFVPEPRTVAVNTMRTLSLVDEVRGQADWLVLPELFLTGYQVTDVRDIALPGASQLIATIVDRTRGAGIGLQVGFAEKADDAVYDSALIVTPAGEVSIYRKTHLFGDEPKAFAAGADLPVIPAGAATVAPLICYDLEFPEPARLAASRGAGIILVSTANMEPYAEQQVLFARTRALENRCFVAVANRVGEESGFTFCGNSIVADPMGRVLVQANDSEEVMLIAECDLSVLSKSRQHGDYLADRRTDLCPVMDGAGEPWIARTRVPRESYAGALEGVCGADSDEIADYLRGERESWDE
ncbi:MAG TPA: nitrilase-related carbon-nitrogen hydrolase [Chloroflexota bacterium]|nr:nitrilase-related carbon-nitrogen hydrolase [Chloroflexota bacterium]